MRQLWVVTLKEIKDNLRDRRAFFFALIYGPVLMPLMLVGPMVLGAKKSFINYDVTTPLYVVGADYAPNLVQHLKKHNLKAIPAPENFKAKIQDDEIDVVLEITPEYGERLREGKRSPLVLYVNHSSKDSQKAATQVRSIINSYSYQMGYWRLQARGIDAELNSAINLIEQDLSSEGLSGMVFGFIMYFLMLFTMMTGGFYLAVDITAGERERNSLEPLLSLPMSRNLLVLGKYFAVLSFVLASGTMSAVSLYLIFKFLPFEELTLVINVNGITLLKAYLIAFPCAFLVASLLIATSAFTRSAKEAQTYIGILYVLPMVPMLIGQFADVKATGATLFIPLFSQYTLIDKVVKGESFVMQDILSSTGGALLLALILLGIAFQLYNRERILAN
ncbi:sodium transport system permease protein [Alteromonadaceae bacterium 2753L.S.0a.02]|nr:sodium transport system permease protein [Alteromonadaceae bacterium 2753L.S.0a.02]